jgi:Tol biopolymer transport system component
MKWLITLTLVMLFSFPAHAQAPTPFFPANSASTKPDLSADGRYVAFASDASNLVSGDYNRSTDVFVADRETGEITRVSINGDGVEGNEYSTNPSISNDGRFVAFESRADNLVDKDINGWEDIFVHDRETGKTTLVSIASDGMQGNLSSHDAIISGDGHFVAFWSNATTLVPNDTNTFRDVFVHDLETSETERLSVSSNGRQGDGDSRKPDISDDGRFVVFWSQASNLVSTDRNLSADIFLVDRGEGEITRVNITSTGSEADDDAEDDVSISGNGAFIAFQTSAGNLFGDDFSFQNRIYLYERETRKVVMISSEESACPSSYCQGATQPVVSGNGRYIAYLSDAYEVDDSASSGSIYLHDRAEGATMRITRTFNDEPLDAFVSELAISDDGRIIAFETSASNVVVPDLNGTTDVFIYDRTSRQNALVSGRKAV